MPASINGIPYILGADPARDYPSTSKGLAEWIDRNTVRRTDPRLTNARTPTSHSHTITQVSGLQTALNAKVDGTDARLTDARTPTSHQHALADVTDLQAALDGKVDDTDPRLSDARTPTAHQHELADVTGLQGQLSTLTYSSGVRDITRLLPEVTAGTVRLWRVGPSVTLNLYGAAIGTVSGSFHHLSTLLPVGFRPPSPSLLITAVISGSSSIRMRVTSSGQVTLYGPTSGALIYGSITYATADAPPTTPFGDPA